MIVKEIQIGKKYWIKTTEESPARPVVVLRKSEAENPWFQCIGAHGDGHIVHVEAFLRPVEPEPVAS